MDSTGLSVSKIARKADEGDVSVNGEGRNVVNRLRKSETNSLEPPKSSTGCSFVGCLVKRRVGRVFCFTGV